MNRFLSSDDKGAAENPRGSQPHQNANKTSRCFVPRRSRGVAAGRRGGRPQKRGTNQPSLLADAAAVFPAERFGSTGKEQGCWLGIPRCPRQSRRARAMEGSVGRCPFAQGWWCSREARPIIHPKAKGEGGGRRAWTGDWPAIRRRPVGSRRRKRHGNFLAFLHGARVRARRRPRTVSAHSEVLTRAPLILLYK